MQKTALSGSLFLYKYKKNSDIEYRICEMFATFVVYILTNTESVSLFSLVNVGNLSSSENERTSSYVVPIWVMAWGCCLFVLQGFPTTYQIK